MLARRVVVTGIGAVTPLGHNFPTTWQNLVQIPKKPSNEAGDTNENPDTNTNEIGITTLEEALVAQDLPPKVLDHDLKLAKTLPSQVAAPVRNIPHDPRTSRFVQFSLQATQEALDSAGLNEWLGNNHTTSNDNINDDINGNDKSTTNDGGHESKIVQRRRNRAGTCIASGMSSVREICQSYDTISSTSSIRRLSPHFVPKILTNAPSSRVSLAHHLRGPNLAPSTACAAAGHAIGDAFRCIQFDDADIMIAGGAESAIDPISMGGFAKLRALSTKFNHEPELASRPFDVDRDGFVMGEGSCILILEELEHAKARGANILCEVRGYGLSGDAYHVTSPHPDGEGAGRAMAMALERAGMSPAMVEYVNAHATSTPMGDEIEERTIHRVLIGTDERRRSEELYVSSTKGATGHLLGAAGALESAFAVQSIVDGIIPETKNLSNCEDTSCSSGSTSATSSSSFHHVMGGAIHKDIKVVMSNSFGFGGTNCSLVFSSFVGQDGG